MRYTIELSKLNGKTQPCIVVHHEDMRTDSAVKGYPKSKYPLTGKSFRAYVDGTKNPEDLNQINYLLAVLGFEPITIDQLIDRLAV